MTTSFARLPSPWRLSAPGQERGGVMSEPDRRREDAALRYLDALDSGDGEKLALLWEEAEKNPELQRLLCDLNAGLLVEEGLANSWQADADRVRVLLRQ